MAKVTAIATDRNVEVRILKTFSTLRNRKVWRAPQPRYWPLMQQRITFGKIERARKPRTSNDLPMGVLFVQRDRPKYLKKREDRWRLNRTGAELRVPSRGGRFRSCTNRRDRA
jgi:hypothetical protein